MGTDIHAAIEHKDNEGWSTLFVPNRYYGKYDDEPQTTARLRLSRNYKLFAILADVRNNEGFAGCDLGDRLMSVTRRRGLPDDLSPEALSACDGDHSGTWVGLTELLEFDWTQTAVNRGFLNAVEFEEWDRMSEWRAAPESYCGDVTGSSVVKVSNEQMRKKIKEVISSTLLPWKEREVAIRSIGWYTKLEWRQSYASCVPALWTDVLPHMLKLARVHGPENVRLVMNFDS